MTRVLVGPFGALVRAGIDDLLAAPATEVAHAGPGQLVDRLLTDPPDVVVLDLDAAGAVEAADRISREFPAVTVLLCSSVDPVLRVFPPFHRGESYERALRSASFTQALRP